MVHCVSVELVAVLICVLVDVVVCECYDVWWVGKEGEVVSEDVSVVKG